MHQGVQGVEGGGGGVHQAAQLLHRPKLMVAGLKYSTKLKALNCKGLSL